MMDVNGFCRPAAPYSSPLLEYFVQYLVEQLETVQTSTFADGMPKAGG